MDEITKERMEVWDKRLEGGLDGGDVADVLGDWDTDVSRYEKELVEVTQKYGRAVLLVNDQNYTLGYFGQKMDDLEKHIDLCAKIIDKLSDIVGAGGEEHLAEQKYWESTGRLRKMTIKNNEAWLTMRGRLAFLDALEQAGVDNWPGYSEAWEIINAEV